MVCLSVSSRNGVGAAGQQGWSGERTMCGVLKAPRCVHNAPQPLPSWLWIACAAERAQGAAGLG